MEHLGTLEIFPGAGFESSILTIILIGVLVRWLCTEWFGFTFAGLVVPGYLASVLIIAPFSGGVIIAESMITYIIVWLLVDYFGDTMVWSASFGRDRFFAFVLVSLFVRLTGELWMWPQLWSVAAQAFELSARPPANLNSLGLVLVPLTANMFWKTGLLRGSVQVMLPTGLVWWVSAKLLIPLTNLRFSKFQVHYEAAAIDILAAPKTYAIMLVGAALAARANIRYGWDFGGILIPALVAISFFEPSKVAISVAEAWVLAMIVQGLLRTPLLRKLNLEGPRRIVLVFGVAYLLKYIVAWVMYMYLPHLQVTDFFSFGYLLSSLLALKIMQRGASRVLTPTLLVSASAFIIGGLGADLLFESLRPAEPAITFESRATSERQIADAERVLLTHAPLLSEVTPTQNVPLSVERLDGVARYISKLSLLDLGAVEGREVSFEVEALGLRHTILTESSGQRSHLIAEPASTYPNQTGVGMLWIRPGATGPAIEVPRGAHDPAMMLAVVGYAQRVQARHVVFGARARLPYGAEVEPLGAIPSLFDHVHQELSTRGDLLRIIPTSRPYSTLWVGGQMSARNVLPGSLDLFGDVRVMWRHPEFFIVPDVEGEAALLELSRSGARAVIAQHAKLSPMPFHQVESLEQEFQRVLFDPRSPAFARQVRQLGRAPSPAELEVVREGIIAPLLTRSDLADSGIHLPPVYVRFLAQEMGLYLEDIGLPDGVHYWMLSERADTLRGWGVVLIRQQRGAQLLLETPRPLREESIWRVTATLAEDMKARVITLGSMTRQEQGVLTAAPMTSPSLLVATHRSWLEMGESQSPLVVQVRGLSSQKDAARHPFIVSHERAFSFEHEEGSAASVLKRLAVLDMPAIVDVGQVEFASLHGFPDLSSQLAGQLNNGAFVRLWVSASMRQGLSPSPSLATWERMLDYTHPSHLAPDDTLEHWFERAPQHTPRDLPVLELDALRVIHQRVRGHVETRNPLELGALIESLEAQGVAMQWLLDEPHGQVWAVCHAEVDGVAMAIALRTSQGPLEMISRPAVGERFARSSHTFASVLMSPLYGPLAQEVP